MKNSTSYSWFILQARSEGAGKEWNSGGVWETISKCRTGQGYVQQDHDFTLVQEMVLLSAGLTLPFWSGQIRADE